MAIKDPIKRKAYQRKWALKNRDRLRELRKKWELGKGADYRKKLRSSSPENTRKVFLKSVYGITPQDYNTMFTNQEGKCAICGIHQSNLKRKLFIDHCHTTDKIRGLLCHHCNAGIGHFKDSTNLLDNAINYLNGKSE